MKKKLFYNARIWRHSGSLYNWIMFDESSGTIEQCGCGEPYVVEGVHMIDMKKQWIFPGFHDSHLHVGMTGAYFNEKVNLCLPKSVTEFKARLKKLIGYLSSNAWLIGYGWDQHMMDRMPTVEDLDEVSPDNPVVLFRVCHHICIVNSLVLSKLNITEQMLSEDFIGKYNSNHKKAGQPNGLLLEDNGVKLAMDIMPEIDSEQKKENILTALNKCLKEGLTSVHTCEDNHWNEYVSLAKDSLLPIHCYYSPYPSNFGSTNCPTNPNEHYKNLSSDIVKVFMDGALGSQTAALSLPYLKKGSDGSENYGILQKSQGEFMELFYKINSAGFRFEIHVIGDKAAEVALNLLESCKVSSDRRPIFVHCQILREDLLDRMLQLGVVPTIQPSFVPTDSAWVKNVLPLQLHDCIYPWKTLLNKGIKCGGSSDSPVETTNPLQGIYDAIFRLSPDGSVFLPGECLSFKEAISLYTTGSAYADFVEHQKGQLEIGFQADIVVLDVPLLDNGTPADLPNNPEILKETKIKEVWVKGKQAYSNNVNS